MAADIQQQIASEIYDSTQQQIKAMSQMWNFENYHGAPQYPMTMKEDKFDPMKSENMMFHPFFAHQFSHFGQLPPSTPSSRDSPVPSKKKPQPVPEEQKDESYRERRRRNNEAARKSREARKKNEDMTGRRLEAAQHENFLLKQEVHRLNTEVENLRYAFARLTSQMNMMSANGGSQILPPTQPPQNPPSY
ncbi:unnamed protein product [Caenorhabditis angaria]|uniref:BZIP domain-containing protein n=1 Tax=Caenorhabditis angaria TaxID=860376 RepID=A0A9P1INH9_9PELO|nr:unnamed protein product [Caenorhabditis angaria]